MSKPLRDKGRSFLRGIIKNSRSWQLGLRKLTLEARMRCIVYESYSLHMPDYQRACRNKRNGRLSLVCLYENGTRESNGAHESHLRESASRSGLCTHKSAHTGRASKRVYCSENGVSSSVASGSTRRWTRRSGPRAQSMFKRQLAHIQWTRSMTLAMVRV